jgi:hypothetical protein
MLPVRTPPSPRSRFAPTGRRRGITSGSRCSPAGTRRANDRA